MDAPTVVKPIYWQAGREHRDKKNEKERRHIVASGSLAEH